MTEEDFKKLKEKWKDAWLIRKESKCWWEKMVDESFQLGKSQTQKDILEMIKDWWANTMNISSTSTRLEALTQKIKEMK
jgi:hypothetical protein